MGDGNPRARFPTEGEYVAIQALWAEEAPTIPLLQRALIAVTQDEVHDVIISPSELLPYFTIRRLRVYLPLVTRNHA